MFIGREKELALLQEDYIGKAIMVYGKRRVGKTTLCLLYTSPSPRDS